MGKKLQQRQTQIAMNTRYDVVFTPTTNACIIANLWATLVTTG